MSDSFLWFFFHPSCRLFFFPLLPRPGRTVSVFSAVTPGRPRGGLRADQSRAPICPGLSSCLSCALMALAAMLGEVARFMLVKRGSVRLKGHVSGCRFVFHRDVQEEVSAQEKKNEREIVLVCGVPHTLYRSSRNVTMRLTSDYTDSCTYKELHPRINTYTHKVEEGGLVLHPLLHSVQIFPQTFFYFPLHPPFLLS